MNLTRAEKIRLGAFVLTGLVLVIGSLLILAGMKVWEQKDRYWVKFSESVSGLEPSAQVKYRGLRVGRVESLKIDPEDPSAIRAELLLDADTPLFEGTQAVLEMSGITGLKIINLTPGDPSSDVLKPDSVLPVGSSLVTRIGSRADVIAEKLERVVVNLERWTSPPNASRVERLLDNANRLFEHMDEMAVEVREPFVAALGEFEKSGNSLRKMSDETTVTLRVLRRELQASMRSVRSTLAETERVLKAVDSKDLHGTVKSAHSAMSTLDQSLSSAQMQQTFSELETALVNITTLAQDMDLTVRASREDLVLSLKYVRQATQDLREFSRIIAQDPSTLLRGTEVSE